MVWVLVVKHVIKDLLKHRQRTLKHNIRELWAAKDSAFHILQFNVFKPKNLLSIVVGNCSALHLTNLHLHDILQEATSDKVIEFSLITWMLALKFANFIIKIIDVVANFISHYRSRSCFKFKYYFLAITIDSLCVNLRAQEHLTRLHVSKIVLISELLQLLLRQRYFRLVCF